MTSSNTFENLESGKSLGAEHYAQVMGRLARIQDAKTNVNAAVREQFSSDSFFLPAIPKVNLADAMQPTANGVRTDALLKQQNDIASALRDVNGAYN